MTQQVINFKQKQKCNTNITSDEESPQVIEAQSAFIERANNRLFFYSQIMYDRVLFLNRVLIDLENEMCETTKRFSLEQPIPIYLHVNSPGGFIHDALLAADFISNSTRRVPIVTIVDGHVASAATLITISGSKRLIQKNSSMLIHQLRGWIDGTMQNIEDNYTNCKKLMDKLVAIYLQKTKLTKKQLDHLLTHDLVLDAKESKKFGLVDEIIE